MKDLSLSEIDDDWTVSNGLHNPDYEYFQNKPLKLGEELDIYPLSPILFDESGLDRLWKEDSLVSPGVLPAASPLTVQSLNGLKSLSWRIKEIVEGHGPSSYQDIADRLMTELQITSKKSPHKSEKNVRRRIYDALNVLVAANVLEKQGKLVISNCNLIPAFVGNSENDELAVKREKLNRLVEKYCAIKNLHERNTMQSRVSQTVPYPLIVVNIPKSTFYDVMTKQMEVEKFGKSTSLLLTIHKTAKVLQDIEILKMIGLHKKPVNLPTELRYLCRRPQT